MNLNPTDNDLDFLRDCTSEELEPIVGAILGKNEDGSICTSGRLTSDLDSTAAFKAFYPEHIEYVDDIIAEVQQYGSNTFATAVRGYGVCYKEVLCDVCDKMNVNFNKWSCVEAIEEQLLAKVIDQAWDKMSKEDRDALMNQLGNKKRLGGGSIGAAAVALFRAGGFKSYQFALILVNAIARAILGRGLTLGANAAVARTLGVLAGPIGWAITGVWTAFDIASAAYRVTIPACVYIASLRMMKRQQSASLDDNSIEVRLAKLKDLNAKGLISNEEYAHQRMQVISEI